MSDGESSLPRVSLIIPTRNRREELRLTLQTARHQTIQPEIIVLDDGSGDGTDQMMRDEFPDVRYERFGGANGPCVLRNRGTELASASIIVSIDDDASFPSPRTIEQAIAMFAVHPQVGAISIPFINVRLNNERQQQPPANSPPLCIYSFIGAACAMRRDVFLELGGYRETLYYDHEESDLCLRMLAAKYVTVMSDADPMHHAESRSRNLSLLDYCRYRNLFLLTWMNVPTLMLVPMLMNSVWRGFYNGIRDRRPISILKGTFAGVVWIIRHPRRRSPVPMWAFSKFRAMRFQPVPLDWMIKWLDEKEAVRRSALPDRVSSIPR